MPESPLVRFQLADAGGIAADAQLVMSERPFLGHLNLRGRPEDPQFLAGTSQVLGVDLPLEPNTTAGSTAQGLFWLGPDEWLILTPPGEQAGLQTHLLEVLDGVFANVVDVSSGNTVISVSGPKARELLAKGTTLDLHPREFRPGMCAQTHFAHAGALICQWEERPRFELVVRRSFADYLWQWMRVAARDLAPVIEAPVTRAA